MNTETPQHNYSSNYYCNRQKLTDALLAFFRSLFPIYCETIIAPPASIAASTVMIKLLNISTNPTPKYPPHLHRYHYSITTPTAMIKICSMISGKISFFNALLENIVSTSLFLYKNIVY